MIRKYQNGGPYASSVVRNMENMNQGFQQFSQPGMQKIQRAVDASKQRIAQFDKANARANRGVRAPMAITTYTSQLPEEKTLVYKLLQDQ